MDHRHSAVIHRAGTCVNANNNNARHASSSHITMRSYHTKYLMMLFAEGNDVRKPIWTTVLLYRAGTCVNPKIFNSRPVIMISY